MLTDATHEITRTYTSENFLRAAAHVEGLKREQCHRALFNARDEYAAALRRMAAHPNDADSVIALTGVALYDYSGWFRSGSASLSSSK